jgi:hypothetical protein
MKTTKELKLATRWEVKVNGKERSIRLFDADGNKLKGSEARWEGNFYCYSNQLTSLEGSPKEVGGSFYCSGNQLTSLKGSPKEVGWNFYCYRNQLTSLEGSPNEVGGNFDCSDNQLTSLKGSPKEVGGSFSCYNNQLTSLEGSPKEVGGDFSCYNNQLTSLEGSPEEVGGYFFCYNNQLTSLEGSPEEVGGYFFCANNQLTSLKGSPKEHSGQVSPLIQERIFDAKIVKGYVYADGILEKLISRRTKGSLEIFKTRKIGSKKEGYVVKRGMTFSHGVTLKQAIEDLMFKVSDRDTSKYKSWKVSQTKNKSELIQAYRKITGACESGVKSFLSSKKIEDKMTVRKVIKLTEGHYGHNEFKQFFGVK